jgi:hypothetical protein
MLPIACKAFGIRTDAASLKNKKRSGDLFKFRQAVSRATREYFGELGPQGYSALNVLTDYATRPEGVLSRESSIDGLQKKAGDWSNQFVNAISSPSFSFDGYLGSYRDTAELINSIDPG